MAIKAVAPDPLLSIGPSKADSQNSPNTSLVQAMISISNLLNPKALLGEGHVNEVALDNMTMYKTLPNLPATSTIMAINSPPTINIGPVSQMNETIKRLSSIGAVGKVPAYVNPNAIRGLNSPQASFFATKSWEYGNMTKQAQPASDTSNQNARTDCKKSKITHLGH